MVYSVHCTNERRQVVRAQYSAFHGITLRPTLTGLRGRVRVRIALFNGYLERDAQQI